MAAPQLPNDGKLLLLKFRKSDQYSREQMIRDLQDIADQQGKINKIIDARLRALEPP